VFLLGDQILDFTHVFWAWLALAIGAWMAMRPGLAERDGAFSLKRRATALLLAVAVVFGWWGLTSLRPRVTS
jgi:hypothetical protein